MGRKRIYKSDKERVEEHRKREKKKLNRKLKNTHGTWMTYNNASEIEKHEEDALSIYYLVQLKNEVFRIIYRYWDKDKAKSRYDFNDFDNLEEAKEALSQIRARPKHKKWENVKQRLTQAERFIRRYKEDSGGDFSRYPLGKMSFIFALSEKVELGYSFRSKSGKLVDFNGGKSSNSILVQENRSNLKTALCRILLDFELCPDSTDGNNEKILEMFNLVAKSVDESGFMSEGTYLDKSRVLLDAFKSLVMFSTVYKESGNIVKYAELARKQAHESNKYNEETGKGTIVPAESYEPIKINHLNKILDCAFSLSPKFFNSLIFELSQMLRPEEFFRFLNDKEKYLYENYALDYKSGELITKTKKKVKMGRLVNPLLSIVSRVIVFHDEMIFDKNFFKKKNGEFRNEYKELKDYKFRNFRTTGATNLAYCERINGTGRSSLRLVQERLGHASLQMAINVYAKNCPDGISPLRYFENLHPVIEIDGKEITAHSTYWDTWLLSKFLIKYKECMSEDEFEKLKSVVCEESIKHDSLVSVSEDELIKKSF